MRALVVAVVVGVVALCSVARADDPASVVIVVDRSAAMKGERIDLVRAAIRDVIENVPDGDRVAVVAFAKRASVVVPLGTNSAKRIEPAIAKLDADASFDENMTVGLELAGSLLQGKGIRHVVLLSNTEASLGAAHAVAALRGRGITLSTVAVQADAHAALGDLAKRGRGGSYAVDDLVDLRGAVRDAAVPPATAPRSRRTIVFVLDRSFSMMGDPLEQSKHAIRDTMHRIPADDVVSIVVFDSEPSVVVQPMAAKNRDLIVDHLARVRAMGGTNIFAALKQAHELLADVKDSTKRVVLITDGGGASDGIKELCEDMHRNNIAIDTVGLASSDRNLLSTITQLTDGRLYMIGDRDAWPQLLAPD